MKDKLTSSADGSGCLSYWHCDAAFALHDDFGSHKGSTFSMGDGAITSLTRKQGMNMRISTKVEVVATDEIVSPMIWSLLKNLQFSSILVSTFQRSTTLLALLISFLKLACLHVSFTAYEYFYKLSKMYCLLILFSTI